MNQSEIRSVIRTLESSVQTGLNASLTPRDCSVLLAAIGRRRGLINQVLSEAGEVAQEVLGELAEDLMRKGS